MPPSPSTLARQLISWFSHNGGYLSSDIQLAHDDSHGFHVVAAGPLSSPVLVSCPLKLTLSVLNLEPDRHDIRSVDSPLQPAEARFPTTYCPISSCSTSGGLATRHHGTLTFLVYHPLRA